MEKFEGELGTGEAGACDMREDVEGAERFEAGEAHVIEATNDEVAAKFVFATHRGDVAFAMLESLDGGVLSHGVGAEDGVLVHLHHGVGERGWSACIADAEACHGESLGKPVQEDGSFAHSGKRGDGDVFCVVVGEFRVDFVGEYDEVVFDAKRGDAFEFFAGLGGSGGVAGKVHHERARARGDALLELLGCEAEVVGGEGGHGNGDAVCEGDTGVVGDVARLVVQHLVAGVDDGAKGEINGFGNADGDDDFGLWVVGDFEVTIDVL